MPTVRSDEFQVTPNFQVSGPVSDNRQQNSTNNPIDMDTGNTSEPISTNTLFKNLLSEIKGLREDN